MAEHPRVRNTCPHCGREVIFWPDVDGSTIVTDADEIPVALPFPSGYAKTRKGFAIHKCHATGDKGHVIR